MKTGRVIFIIIVTAVILRVAYVFIQDNILIGSWEDQGWTIAKNLVEGRGYMMTVDFGPVYSARPPVFPLFLAGIFSVFGQSLLAARLILSLVGGITCLVIYLLGKQFFSKEAGLIAMAIYAVYPPAIYWSSYMSQETLTILFLALTALFLLKARGGKAIFSALSGVCLGLLVLTRSTGYGLVPLFLFWLAISCRNKTQGFRSAFLLLCIFIITISPWVIRNYKVHRTILLSSTEGGVTFYVSNNPEMLTKGNRDLYYPRTTFEGDLSYHVKGLSEIESDRYFYGKGMEFIKSNTKEYLSLLWERFIRFWRFYPHITGAGDSHRPIHIMIMFLTDMPLILVGFFGLYLLFKKDRAGALLVSFIFFNFTVISMLIRANIRYRAPVMPYLVILAAYAFHLVYMNMREAINGKK